MAIVYKIHPAIGVARVGNSPDEFFIGPERMGEQPAPQGGFKDAQCRVKRQAARFRIYAHHGNGTVEEITKAKADITWTVHLANKKAAFGGRGNSGSASDLTIDPGPRTVNGPNQQQLFDNGKIKFSGASATTVPLGEIRSDPNNHLLVLGGLGTSASPSNSGMGDFWKNPGWYDDISDGPVTATIKLLSDNSTPAVTGAWVIVAPPKFSPQQDNIMSLYDRIFQVMVKNGLATAATKTSYTKDIYPILQRTRDIRGVIAIPFGAMTWPDPVTDDATRIGIFNSLKKPGGGGADMPQLNPPDTGDPLDFQTDRLTVGQFAHMERWKDNNYTNDWVGPPPPEANVTPDGLDRSALDACVGGSFYPGIEAGGLPQSASGTYPGLAAQSRPIVTGSNYVEAFRLNHAVVSAGDITASMALPWQADFWDCAQNWWPVPRPNQVTRNGTLNQGWTDGLVGSHEEMVQKWNQLGFVVRQGDQLVESERCDTSSITLLTPLLNFKDVPQGPMGMVREIALAISFEVISPSSAVTLQYAPGGAPANPQLVAFNISDTVGPTPANGTAMARLWVIYRTGNDGDVLPPQTIKVQDSGATQSWVVTIIGNTVGRRTAATALVMDRSGSMSEDRGDGESKHTSLQQAASIFVDVMLEGDGVGLVRFNQDAQPLQPIVQLGDGTLSDVNRGNTKDFINGAELDPTGDTSIGDGIFEGRALLTAAAAFDVQALVVLTDGVENRPLMIADVAAQINETTYAVGLGQPQNISVPALQIISGNNGGYLLVTGAIGTHNRFLLQKYFLQILAGISNAEIVLDPEGELIPGRVERVPFQLTEADAGVDVILLTPSTQIVDFRLQTPSGRIIEPWRAMSEPGMRFILSSGVSYYRLALPVKLIPNRLDGGGTWSALLTIGRPRVERGDASDGTDQAILSGMFAPIARPRALAAEEFVAGAGIRTRGDQGRAPRAVPYNLVVHAYSNISLEAHLEQGSFAPGARVILHASLAQSGIPLAGHAQVWAELTPPSGSTITLLMPEGPNGQFTAEFATTRPGVYPVRIRARGATQGGKPFTREKTLTAVVWRGGDSASDPGAGQQNGDARLCELLQCFVQRDGAISAELEKRLHALGIDIERLRKCLIKYCRSEHASN